MENMKDLCLNILDQLYDPRFMTLNANLRRSIRAMQNGMIDIMFNLFMEVPCPDSPQSSLRSSESRQSSNDFSSGVESEETLISEVSFGSSSSSSGIASGSPPLRRTPGPIGRPQNPCVPNNNNNNNHLQGPPRRPQQEDNNSPRFWSQFDGFDWQPYRKFPWLPCLSENSNQAESGSSDGGNSSNTLETVLVSRESEEESTEGAAASLPGINPHLLVGYVGAFDRKALTKAWVAVDNIRAGSSVEPFVLIEEEEFYKF